ncbi:type II toxin-antitoxin system MqsR family toxin [Secundilactobacillus muriivasis]
MNKTEALTLAKYLMENDRFQISKRRAMHAQPISNALAKEIMRQLKITDFVKYEEDRNPDYSGEFAWVFETQFGEQYYIKFKFKNNNTLIWFISFHPSLYN